MNLNYTTECELLIVSNTILPEIITEYLNINPDRSFKKNERYISKNSGSMIIKPHNLWAVKSKAICKNSNEISPHIKSLKSILNISLDKLNKIKDDPNYDAVFWIWLEDETNVFGIELTSEELNFINLISNRLNISFNGNVKKL